MRIRWTRRADCDLNSVADYIADDNPQAAARVVLRIVEAVGHLSEHPHLGRPGRVPDTRELVVKDTPYVVPYRVRGGELEILRVLHGSMRWPESL